MGVTTYDRLVYRNPACTHRRLPAGSVVSVDADGAVEWETVKRLTVRVRMSPQ
ncbi:putative phage/plasmid replication, II/X domain protein [Escherichia coli]|nr:putative phage/plasmid replication, II/X domain protein [Escherichia coli]